MKQKLVMLVSALLTFGALSANAADSSMQNTMAGNMQVGGQVFYQGTGGSDNGVFAIDPTVEYFLGNGFSLGGTINADFFKHYNTLSIGPSATWYFWQQDRNALYLGVGVYYNNASYSDGYSSNASNWMSNVKVGYNYFFTPSVALGPVVSWSHGFTSNTVSETSDMTYVGFMFSTYL